MVRYVFSFRSVKFAALALLGWMAVPLPLAAILVAVGLPQAIPATVIAFLPFEIWYVRRANRDRAEFRAQHK